MDVLYHSGLLTDQDIYLFRQGNHFRLYEKLGSHIGAVDGMQGTHFAVWAPNAKKVSVIGDFNGWDPDPHPLKVREDGSGLWEGFIPGIGAGTLYKYRVVSHYNNYTVNKGDPFAPYWEVPPKTASIVWDLGYEWHDAGWIKRRFKHNALNAPMSFYEVHLGSWRRMPEEQNRPLTYRETAPLLTEYVKEMGFTHVELMPVMEHPFYGSWGYQIVGFFAPTSRFGTPQDFMYLVDCLHQNNIGVILDWVPSHFPVDGYGLSYFDGTHLFEHADRRKGYHPEWSSYIFNYGRLEVRSFLISSALFWLDKYHADGLRVDGVASMLYLDYARKNGEWIPNQYGGKENIEAISFVKRLNEAVYEAFPGAQTIAEESTAWSMVTRPTYSGGLGFGMKWNMGWMHDTLDYFSQNTIFRKYHHNQITFSIWYVFTENFVVAISHDEVVHGKGSLYGKMPGDDWQKCANLRLLFGYMFSHPGKKLIFMGSEFGQWPEWNHESSIEWHALQFPLHRGIQMWVRDLNNLYRRTHALYDLDFDCHGFEWMDLHDWENSVVSFLRKGKNPNDTILVVCNFTPVPRYNYIVGVPKGGFWRELLNSDGKEYGGSGTGNGGGIEARQIPCKGKEYSLGLTLPPLGVIFFQWVNPKRNNITPRERTEDPTVS